MPKFYIKIIVEGSEEYNFFEIVKELGTHRLFCLEIEDAGGSGNIGDCFLSNMREGELYDCIICVYDVDNKATEIDSPYNLVRKQLNDIFGNDTVTSEVSFCTNPNILQWFLLFADNLKNVQLTSTSKATNTELVQKYWPKIGSAKVDKNNRKIKPNYDAKKWQLEIIKYSILDRTYPYDSLFKNAECLSTNYKESIPASNILNLLIALRDGNKDFFIRIHDITENVD